MTPRLTALVTGASNGIGAAFARSLAHDGFDLVLVARRRDRLDALAESLRAETGSTIAVIDTDLSDPGAAERLVSECETRGLTIDFLLNSAGFGTHGPVVETDATRLSDEIRLNCEVLAELSRRFLPGMLDRHRGTILNIASTAAFQPLPSMAVYGATKAFVLSFTEALWHETRGTGVRVLAVCPGPVDTAFFDVAGGDFSRSKRSTEQVVATAKRALARNRFSVVDGTSNALVAGAVRFLPRRVALAAAARAMRPR